MFDEDLLVLVVVVVATLQLGLVKPAHGQCEKIGPCSCRSAAGIIDLSPIAAQSNGSATFADQMDPSGLWMYSYNPCHGFDENQCRNVAACQLNPHSTDSYPTGTQDSAVFKQDHEGNVVIEYKATDSYGTQRTTHVTLICDQSADNLTVLGETGPSSAVYAFQLRSVHCCPVPPTTTPIPTTTPSGPTLVPGECVQTGPCSCRSPQGTVDLTPLARTDGTALFQDISECNSSYSYSYNPCSPFTERGCSDVAACLVNKQFDITFPLASHTSSEFHTDPITGDLLIVYRSTGIQGITSRMVVVRLICEPSGEDHSLKVFGETGRDTGVHMMTLTSVYCCPRQSPGDSILIG